MDLPEDVRERSQALGCAGGRARAGTLNAGRRTEIARRAATARWVRRRFGASRFADLALPGGDLVDEGLADLASGRTSAASLLVSLAAPRLRREGVPVTNTQSDPETPNNNVTPLRGTGGFRLRVGDWRVLYSLDSASNLLRVAAILPRGEAYR